MRRFTCESRPAVIRDFSAGETLARKTNSEAKILALIHAIFDKIVNHTWVGKGRSITQ